MATPIRAKKHRLPEYMYRGQKNVAFTCNVQDRQPLFRDAQVVTAFLRFLTEASVHHGCLVAIYCFMPDHIHLVVCGQNEKSHALEAVSSFKYQATTWLNENRPAFALQDGSYDHIIRKHDDWRSHVIYAYMNPVRAGLVQDPDDYPFTGSIGCDLKDILIDY